MCVNIIIALTNNIQTSDSNITTLNTKMTTINANISTLFADTTALSAIIANIAAQLSCTSKLGYAMVSGSCVLTTCTILG